MWLCNSVNGKGGGDTQTYLMPKIWTFCIQCNSCGCFWVFAPKIWVVVVINKCVIVTLWNWPGTSICAQSINIIVTGHWGCKPPPLWQGCNGSHLGTRVYTRSINIIVTPNLIICTLTLWEIWSSSKLLKNIFYEHFEVFWWSSYVASKLTSLCLASLYQVLCLTNLLHSPAVWLFEIWQTISNSLKYVFSE